MNQARVFGLFVWALREIVTSALVLLGASFLLFLVARVAPGNRAESLSWLTRAPVGSPSVPSDFTIHKNSSWWKRESSKYGWEPMRIRD